MKIKKMKNFKKIIIFILVLNQLFKIETSEIFPTLPKHKSVSGMRQKMNLFKERLACLQICNECFNDDVY